MTLAQRIAKEIENLPEDRQREVMDFVEFLVSRGAAASSPQKEPLISAYGLWKDEKPGITEEDIAKARREMWGNFPREDI